MPRKKKLDMKKTILEFIQEKGFDLRKTIPGLVDVRYEGGPDRVVLTMPKLVKAPELKHNDVLLPVEVEVFDAAEPKVEEKAPEEIKPILMVDRGEGAEPEVEEMEDKDDVFHREFSKQAAEMYRIKEAVGPHTTADQKDVDENKAKAVEAWKQRHSRVKIKSDEEK